MGVQGICPRQELLQMVQNGIISIPEFDEKHVQASSLDLRLGGWCKRVTSGFLPGSEQIENTAERYTRYDFDLTDDDTNVLEQGLTYICPLLESTNLPEGFVGWVNPKSTTGRADVLTRVLVEGVPIFDTVRPGSRKLYVEITPLSWNIRVKRRMPISQLRIGFGREFLDEASLRIDYAGTPLLFDYDQKPIPLDRVHFRNDGIELTTDLRSEVVAYRARIDSQLVLDLTGGRGSLTDRFDEFWEPIERPKNGEFVREPDLFYLLATRERTRLPPGVCGTLEAYDPASSEGRVHYAGFADAGFGHGATGEVPGTSLTLETRGSHTPFRFVDGQPIGVIRYQRMRAVPVDEKGNIAVYGAGIYKDSNYQNQRSGPNPGKQFQPTKATTATLQTKSGE